MGKTAACFHCNTKLKVELKAIKITNIGGKKGTRIHNIEDMDEKIVEGIDVNLSVCPKCGRQEKILGEEVKWYSLKEIFDAVKNGKIISENPEIETLFKVMEMFLKGMV